MQVETIISAVISGSVEDYTTNIKEPTKKKLCNCVIQGFLE